MTEFNIVNGGSTGAGGFLKPADYAQAHLIIFEPTGQRTSKFTNTDGTPKFEAVGDWTVFNTPGELETGKPGEVHMESVISSGTLAKVLIENMNGIVVGSLSQTEPKGGRQGYWKIDPVAPENIGKVKEYLAKRQEERDADKPDWMK